MATDHKLCMIPGPVEFAEDVLKAMSTPATSHVDPNFIKTFSETLNLVKKLVYTKTGQPFVIAGSGTLGWEIVASNLLQANEEALILNTGMFGDRFGDCMQVFGVKVTHLNAKAKGARHTAQDLEAHLKNEKSPKYNMISITQVDTSTGVLQDVKGLIEIIKESSSDSLIVVDGVCSVAAEKLLMDSWGVDVVLTASQKAIGVPPGLCIAVVSERGMKKFHARTQPPSTYYASFNKWLPIMQAYSQLKPAYFATPPVQLIMALHVALKKLMTSEDGGEFDDSIFDKHIETSNKFKNIVTKEWGLKMLPEDLASAAHSMTVLYYPDKVAGKDLLPKISARGVIVAGGIHPKFANEYFRIGHMGISATDSSRKDIEEVLDAVKEALKECGYKFPDVSK